MAQSIKQQLLSGAFFTAVAKYSNLLISLLVTAILARMLPPADFGIVAIATVIIAFFNMFTEIGISPAIVQNRDLSQRDISNIFSFTIYFGLILSLAFVLCATPIAHYYDDARLRPICYYLSVSIFFMSCQIVPTALLYKEKLFKFIAMRSFVVQLIGGALSVGSIYIGFGLYALLVNPILSSILIFAITYLHSPIRFRAKVEFASIKKILSFSVYQFMFNLINYFSRNLDKLIIGKYLGKGSLGYYEKSYRLMMLPLQTITQVVSPVMQPVFADFQDDYKKLSSSYLQVVKLLAYIGFPLSVLLFFTSRELVLLIFGGNWVGSIMSFRILSLSVGFQIILSTSGPIFQAANAPKMLFLNGVISTFFNVIAILAGVMVFKRIDAVALGLLCSFVINFFICYASMYRFVFKIRTALFLKELVLPFVISCILFVVMMPMNSAFAGANMFLSLVAKSFVAIVVTLIFIQWWKVYDLRVLAFKIKEKMHKK